MQVYIIALTVCCAATKTLILHKALKLTIYTHIVTPYQTSYYASHLSGDFQFFAPVAILHAHPIASSKLAANYMNFRQNVAL